MGYIAAIGPMLCDLDEADQQLVQTVVSWFWLLNLRAARHHSTGGSARPAWGKAYALTPWGLAFREPLRVMGAWASQSPHLRFEHRLSASAAMLSLGNMFDKEQAGDLRLVVDLRLPYEAFAFRVEDGQLSVESGRNQEPDVVVTGDQNALLPVLYAGKSWRRQSQKAR